jgi:2-polyprenyl-3-methyl-5-hydroxy-6-metoxy-1,4-benzoquinol methylase
MQKLGEDLVSIDYWKAEAEEYNTALKDEYHRHRLGVIKSVIPQEIFQKGKRVMDFGCGTAVLFPPFLKAGVDIRGIDLTPEMIAYAKEDMKKWGADPDAVRVGTVEALREEKSASYDALMCFNVMAYFTTEEDRIFYEEAARILKPGGYLIITHGNELFDLFTLNKFTVEFMQKYLITDPAYAARIPSLVTNPQKPENVDAYNVRENPLSFQYKLKSYNFREVKQAFIRKHTAPPLLKESSQYPDTISVSEEERWKLLFTCSMFASCSVRV